jgi:cell division FtsZ-interacting protein ZapD
VLDIQTARSDYPDVAERGSQLDAIEQRARQLHHKTRLNTFVDAASKAEFKGQLKKALDQYQEALYFLRSDDIEDAQQTGEIEGIEAKIAEMTEKIGN